MKRILFITPTFARTGSEMVLWNLICNLDPGKYEVFLFSLKQGELLHALPNHIKTAVPYKISGIWYKKAFRKLLKLFGVKNFNAYQLKQIQKRFKADLWFVNTIIVPDAYIAAKGLGVKVATYFHEMDNAFGFITSAELKTIIESSFCCIGCSEIVVEKLHGLGHKNIKLSNSFIDEEAIHTDQSIISTIKNNLGIKPDQFVWVISGTACHMKGLDLIIPILNYFKETGIQIVWIGEQANRGLDWYVEKAADKIMPGGFTFTGPISENYYNYLGIGDGLLILSREETFSLVMLEAAYLQKPIVAFRTGMADNFIEDDMGKVVDPSNIEQLCMAMKWMQENAGRIDRIKLRTKTLEFTRKRQIPRFEALIDELLS